MIGRGAIRNPWLFAHLRAWFAQGKKPEPLSEEEIWEYILRLYGATRPLDAVESKHIAGIKRYLNFIGPGLGVDAGFLHDIRRVRDEASFLDVGRRHLEGGRVIEDLPPETSIFAGIVR